MTAEIKSKTAWQRSLTDDKDMVEIRRWTKQEEAAIRTINAQQDCCEEELNRALEEYAHATNFDPNAICLERLKERENLTNEARTDLKNRFGADYSEKRLSFAEQQILEMLPKEKRELRRYWKEICAKQRINGRQSKELFR